MSIIFTCPSCGTKLKVREQAAGKRLNCLKCRGSVSVPSIGPGSRTCENLDEHSEVTDERDECPDDADEREGLPGRLREKPGKLPLIALALAGAVGVAACVTIAVVITVLVMKDGRQGALGDANQGGKDTTESSLD
jgi:hypothetical protein